MLAANIRARIFELEEVRTWERNPQFYADILASSLAAQALFTYAPAAERARRVLSKLRQAPRLIQAARDNIKDPPGIFVKVGLETLRGALKFIEHDLPRAFSGVDDLHLLGDLADASTEASDAIEGYIELPRDGAGAARRAPRSGSAASKFEQKLQARRRASRIGVDRLLAIADARAAERRRRSSGASPARLNGGDPLAAWRADQGGASRRPASSSRSAQRAARRARHVPRAARPRHRSRRASRSSSRRRRSSTAGRSPACGRPGPFETQADARLLLPDRRRSVVAAGAAGRAPARLQLRRRSGRSRSTRSTRATSCTTSTCGRSSRRLRKSILFAPASFVEGWAHYCEQMMIEAGFGRATTTSGSASSPKRSSASPASSSASGCTPRTCRWSRACASSATRRSWRRRARGARPSAARSTRPTSSTAAGKLMLLKLRQDYKAQQGKASSRCARSTTRCSAQRHRAVLAHRQLMLGDGDVRATCSSRSEQERSDAALRIRVRRVRRTASR